MKTAGRWPRKSESSKECVTTHLPNSSALKMDGAQAARLYSSVAATITPQRVGVREASVEAYAVKRRGRSFSADLGCSSK